MTSGSRQTLTKLLAQPGEAFFRRQGAYAPASARWAGKASGPAAPGPDRASAPTPGSERTRHERSSISHAEKRVSDLHDMFRDPEVRLILSAIGGDIRVTYCDGSTSPCTDTTPSSSWGTPTPPSSYRDLASYGARDLQWGRAADGLRRASRDARLHQGGPFWMPRSRRSHSAQSDLPRVGRRKGSNGPPKRI
jgi:LD-carboxypeptidase